MQSIQRQIAVTLSGILSIITVGTTGYMLIEKWDISDSFFMTVITVTTVGYGEIRQLSPAGRLFTSILIVLGFSFVAYLSGQFAQIIIHGELSKAFGKRRMKKLIAGMKNHYIVVGYGRVGQTVCADLLRCGLKVIAAECDEGLIARAMEKEIPIIGGDALDDEVLIAAGVERASGVVSVVNKDSDNLLITLSARELNHNLHIVARGESQGIEAKLLRAGADLVISPYRITGQEIAAFLTHQKPIMGDSRDNRDNTHGYHLHAHRLLPGQSSNVADICKATGAIKLISIKRRNGEEICLPEPDVVVTEHDHTVLLHANTPITSTAARESTKSRKIIVADDHKALLKITVKKLRAAGYEVIPTESGTDALEAIRREEPDLVVLDVMMPGMDGFDVCKAIRSDEKLERIPVVLFSVAMSSEFKAQAEKVKASAAMQKTGKITELLDTISELLGEEK